MVVEAVGNNNRSSCTTGGLIENEDPVPVVVLPQSKCTCQGELSLHKIPQKVVVDLPMIRGVRVQMRVRQISLKGYWFEFLPTKALVWNLFQTSSGPESGLWSFMCTFVVIGCNVASVQSGVKKICDSTPKLCSHKPEESTVLFCSAPLPPYSC